MKLTRTLLGLVALICLALTNVVQAAQYDFYWKGSYGRGVGVIPALECPSGKQKVGELCYDACRAGYNVAGLQCAVPCPSGYSDRGLLCHYQGSASYVPGTHWDNCKSRTKKVCKWGVCVGGDCIGGLEQDSCRDGYNNTAGVCWYTRLPSGMSGSPLDPMKQSYALANPVAQVQVCRDGKTNQAGLCYEPCRSGYNGVGPVCWANTPSGYVDCVAGYAKNVNVCLAITGGQVASVAGLVAVLAPPSAIAAAKANAGRLYQKAGNAANSLLEAAPDMVKVMTRMLPEFTASASSMTRAISAGENVAGQMSNFSKLSKAVFTQGPEAAKLWGIFSRLNRIGTNVSAEAYFSPSNVSDALAISRDTFTFISLVLGVYSFTNPPMPYPSPVDIPAAFADVMAAYMYSIYGQ